MVVCFASMVVRFGLKYTVVKNLVQAPLIDQENARCQKGEQTNMFTDVFQSSAKLRNQIGLKDQKRWDCKMV